MNSNYSREIVISTLEKYIEQIDNMNNSGKGKYSKIYKSLKDTIKLLNSLNDLNVDETNEYFRLLLASISTSMIIK